MERDLLTNWAFRACIIVQGRGSSRVAIFNLMAESEEVIKRKVANLLKTADYHVTLKAVLAAWDHCDDKHKGSGKKKAPKKKEAVPKKWEAAPKKKEAPKKKKAPKKK